MPVARRGSRARPLREHRDTWRRLRTEARHAEQEAALERKPEREVHGGVLCRSAEVQEDGSCVVWR
jgi:hypothetical protein